MEGCASLRYKKIPMSANRIDRKMNYLDKLENQSIYIIREAYSKFKRLGVLWSMGKDSTTLIWLIRKAFFGHCPIPVIHIDTSYKIPEMIGYRDNVAREWNLNLVVSKNTKALKEGMSPEKGRIKCCEALKTRALQNVVAEKGYNGLMLAIRRDEEGTRAKERIFSPRDNNFEWNFRNQPPEFWEQFNTNFDEDTHVRIHPILQWTELNVWEYIERENIPVIDLYFAKGNLRYRSLGCKQCTAKFKSGAKTIPEIIEELKWTKKEERAGRAQDKEDTYAMQKLRVKGYM